MPRQAEGVARTPDETLDEAQRLLDAHQPFHAHEVFEDAWKADASAHTGEAGLWKALAQLAVGVTHRLRGNAVGARRLLERAAGGLAPYVEYGPHGIDVEALRRWATAPDDGPMPPLRRAR
jgi:hypothetical protein